MHCVKCNTLLSIYKPFISFNYEISWYIMLIFVLLIYIVFIHSSYYWNFCNINILFYYLLFYQILIILVLLKVNNNISIYFNYICSFIYSTIIWSTITYFLINNKLLLFILYILKIYL